MLIETMIEKVMSTNIVREINQELAVSGQIKPDQLEKLTNDGYQSVMNLCFADEPTFWQDEQQQILALGLHYVHLPTKIETLNYQTAIVIYQVINKLPKPLLIHCDNSKRSAAIVLLYISNKQGIPFEKVWQQTITLDLL